MVFRITVLILLVTQALTSGARVEFVGLRSFTSESLLEAVAGRMDYIRKRKATDSRADDAAYLVESYLRNPWTARCCDFGAKNLRQKNPSYH